MREHDNLTHKAKGNTLNLDNVMLIKGDNMDRATWKLGIVTLLIPGHYVICGTKLKTNKRYLEQAVQHLHPMELRRDVQNAKTELNPQVLEFRPKRKAAPISNLKTYKQLEEGSEPLVEH